MQHFFLGIFPPEIASVLLPIIVFGVVGFLLSYFHRYLGFLALPVFIGYCLYTINFLEFFVSLISGYMAVVYSTMLFSIIAILIGMRQSWVNYKKTRLLK